MARPSSLLAGVRTSAKKLGVAAAWAHSRRPVRVKEDFLYEIYVLFRLVEALSSQYGVHYFPGIGKTKHAFPRKPAKKAGRPRFNIKDQTSGQSLWQLCAGTKIGDLDGNEHGVDLSLQSADSPEDGPDHSHVLIAWECKYKEEDTKRITKSEYLAFATWIEMLVLKAGPKALLCRLEAM